MSNLADVVAPLRDVGIANVLWPCAACPLDEYGMPACQAPAYSTLCETGMEGEVEVFVSGDVTVTIDVNHTGPGTLTVLGATSDIDILNLDETPFTSAQVTGSGQSLVPVIIRASATFSGEVTLTARFLQDNAELDSQDVVTVKEGEYQVEIADANDNELIGDQTTIVGKHIVIKGKVIPANAFVTKHEWTINGDKVKDYEQSMSEGKITEFIDDPNDDFSHVTDQDVDFYWIAGSDDSMTMGMVEKFTVTYTATIGGNDYSDSVEYEVLRPTATLNSITTTETPPIRMIRGPTVDSLQFGNSAPGGSSGIKWPAQATTPEGGAGQIAFVQTANVIIKANGGVWIISTNGDYYLDRANNPNNFVQYGSIITNIGSNDTKSHLLNQSIPDSHLMDSPLFGLTNILEINTISIDQKYRLYFMYKPAGADSIWVTLRRLDWFWKASVTRDGNAVWQLDMGQSSSTNPTSNDSTELPQWPGRVQDLTWQDP